jgi:hypothetical protein
LTTEGQRVVGSSSLGSLTSLEGNARRVWRPRCQRWARRRGCHLLRYTRSARCTHRWHAYTTGTCSSPSSTPSPCRWTWTTRRWWWLGVRAHASTPAQTIRSNLFSRPVSLAVDTEVLQQTWISSPTCSPSCTRAFGARPPHRHRVRTCSRVPLGHTRVGVGTTLPRPSSPLLTRSLRPALCVVHAAPERERAARKARQGDGAPVRRLSNRVHPADDTGQEASRRCSSSPGAALLLLAAMLAPQLRVDSPHAAAEQLRAATHAAAAALAGTTAGDSAAAERFLARVRACEREHESRAARRMC